MFKRSTSAASIVALALALATSAAFAADKPVYGVLMKTLSNPFWGAMEKGVDEGGKSAGVEIFLELADPRGDVGLYAMQPLGGARHAALTHHGAKDAQIG